jgi:aarF domain-containing kinase
LIGANENRASFSQLKCSDVARLVAKTFAEMIFIHGDVHCDPHAANLLVRRSKDGLPELVLLDHGLYRVLDDEFRIEYAVGRHPANGLSVSR